jgi:SAM-dependent methyltransferase/uncharacterized protein YbaR (Trm112 family)
MIDAPPAVPSAIARLLDRLRCPRCRGSLVVDGPVLACGGCGTRYPVVEGIPILLEADQDADHDELEHLVGQGGTHKHAQAAFFDEASAAEFEITRPRGAASLYSWLLGEKLRLAMDGLEPLVSDGVVLVVCGGSGMDADFYARAGARVINADISLGAARRSQERARRYGLDITAVVADAERLPFEDRSVHVVAVHDGLHHLEHPDHAIREMARVAASAVSITEPADAAITRLAVRAGLALDREEAGNKVVRLRPPDVSSQLRDEGFEVLAARRYFMYYRHVPGPISRLLSRPALLPIVQAALRLVNAGLGRFGNKQVVVARRTSSSREDA